MMNERFWLGFLREQRDNQNEPSLLKGVIKSMAQSWKPQSKVVADSNMVCGAPEFRVNDLDSGWICDFPCTRTRIDSHSSLESAELAALQVYVDPN
jgi:hypothetical protein